MLGQHSSVPDVVFVEHRCMQVYGNLTTCENLHKESKGRKKNNYFVPGMHKVIIIIPSCSILSLFGGGVKDLPLDSECNSSLSLSIN